MRRLSHLASVSLIALASLAGASGCVIIADTDNPADPAVDPPADGTQIAGLDGKVEVIVDDRGMPHIYAETLHDAVMVQGYLMAKDRFPQMEMIRRNVTGRLAEFIGPLSPDVLADDVAVRVTGFKRIADKIYASLPEGDETRVALDAFAAGVNIYIQAVRDKKEQLPPGSQLIELLVDQKDVFTDWTPQDSLAIGRYLSHALSYDAGDDIALTEAMALVAAKFPDQTDLRAGLFRDFWSFAPARDVFTQDGFPNVPTDTGSQAIVAPPGEGKTRNAPVKSPAVAKISPTVIESAKGYLASVERLSSRLGDESRGSNNWIVAGSKSASGSPLLANDPHLSLPSPPLFWYSHLNTKRAGGVIDVAGISLAGAPGILLGFNEHIAWGATTAGHDVTDVYSETITPGASGGPDTVLFKGQQVPIEKVTETVKVSGGSDVVFDVEIVPHHGVIIPKIENGLVVPRDSNEALSVRWTGDQVSHEISAFMKLSFSTNVDEARAALDSFEVGAQSFVVVTRDGDIFWSSQSKLPVRDPKAMTYNPETQEGLSPAMILPGDGTAEWTGFLEDKYIPHALNPEKGYIATANNDLVGITKDGNPFNDPHYTTYSSDLGHRVARITERLEEVTAKGATPEDMMSIQGDHKSALGSLLAPSFIAAAKRVIEERAKPGKYADIQELVAGAAAEDLDKLAEAVSRLEAWTSFDTPAGVDIGDGAPPEAEVQDSVAATLFNASAVRVVNLAFKDEADAIGMRPGSSNIAKVLQWSILDPQKLATFDSAIDDTVLWDDLATNAVKETRNERIARGMLDAIAFLRGKLGEDMGGWQWGKLHTLRFESLVPSLSGDSPVSIPKVGDTAFPNGFPRPGDNFGVDASNHGMWNPESFSYGSGPVQRIVVEMTPDGPKVWNALPGGQAYDPDSKHHADEAELWRRNKATPMYFTESDVKAHAETTLSFTP